MKHFLPALIFVLKELLKILLVPYNLYCKSIERLIETKESSALSIQKSESNWPFLSFLKRLLLEFLLDAFTLLVYPLAIIVFSVVIFQDSFLEGLAILFGSYIAPVILSIARDLVQILILPFKKYIDWAKKPAQHLNLDIKNN
ncbi:MAG TPA: hypothetical protein DIT65_02435 [Cryomorphaceae bacterium]|nr:hypothetical protein [Cryomorphaceae bacterium]|tara:strand:+ start:73 stop:501 length:429 start_codon:yes stop_codon:yes gene_type:complete